MDALRGALGGPLHCGNRQDLQEIETVYGLQVAINYFGLRENIFAVRVSDLDRLVEIKVDTFLAGATGSRTVGDARTGWSFDQFKSSACGRNERSYRRTLSVPDRRAPEIPPSEREA